MRIADVMTPCPHNIDDQSSLGDAVKLMALRSVRHLPVVDANGDLVGVLNEKDARLQLFVCENTNYCATAGQVCQKDPLVVRSTDEVSGVASEMFRTRSHCALVSDTEGNFIGIFTSIDACRTLHLLLSENGAAIKAGAREVM